MEWVFAEVVDGFKIPIMIIIFAKFEINLRSFIYQWMLKYQHSRDFKLIDYLAIFIQFFSNFT